MQNKEKCDLCISDEMKEYFELQCCHMKYCKLCVVHLKANNTANCSKCNSKIIFKLKTTKQNKKMKKKKNNETIIFLCKEIVLE